MQGDGLPQLRMRLASLDCLPPVVLPVGYHLRRFGRGDEQAWIEVLNGSQALGEWDLEKARRSFTGERARVVPEGIHLVFDGSQPVATACLTEHDDFEEAELGWVAVSPEHRGKGLGFQVCLATLHYMRHRAYGAAVLFTDDHRLPALKTYLRLGFRPWLTHESHAERWQRVLARLGISRLDCACSQGGGRRTEGL